MKPHSFGDQFNVLKSIIQDNSLSEHFKFIGKYKPKLCKLKIKYFDNTEKLYRAAGLVHNKKIKRNVEMGMFSTPNTATSIKSTKSIENFHLQNMFDQWYRINYATIFAHYFSVSTRHAITCLMWGKYKRKTMLGTKIVVNNI